MSWAAVTWMAIGAGVGAGVGQITGGNTKSTMQGAGYGAAAGLGGYAMFGGAGGAAVGTGAKVGAGAGSTAPLGYGGGPAAASWAQPIGTTGGGGLASLANPLMLGQAGLALAGAFSNTGTAFQQKVKISKEGEALKKTFATTAKATLEQRKKGDVSDLAFGDIHRLKVSEGQRERGFTDVSQNLAATIANKPRLSRGTVAGGGSQLKAISTATGERVRGLFAPTSTLNNYRREGLMNAVKDLSNLYSIENQVASFQYGGQLSNWQSEQMLATDRGAAIGQSAAMIGGGMMNQAYLNRINAA